MLGLCPQAWGLTGFVTGSQPRWGLYPHLSLTCGGQRSSCLLKVTLWKWGRELRSGVAIGLCCLCGEQPWGGGQAGGGTRRGGADTWDRSGRGWLRGRHRAVTDFAALSPPPASGPRSDLPVSELCRWGPASRRAAAFPRVRREPGVGRAGRQLLGLQVSSRASARPGHFLCAL